MVKARASIFEDPAKLDMDGFAPRTTIDANAPPAEQVRAVAQAAQFHSRESTPPRSAKPSKRVARRYRTGRNVQFNIKALQETVDAFYEVSEAQGWVLGYTLQRAMDALRRELGNSA